VPGKQGEYQERVPGAFEKLRRQRNLDDSECTRVRDVDFEQTQPSPQPEPLNAFPPGVAHATRTLSP
jgi:hypothetical protein